MPPLPVISGEAAIGAFDRAGWRCARQKGSHISLTNPGVNVNLSVPLHRELDRGTLRKLIRLSGLPQGLSKDRQALERFQPEAQAASGLNHSNLFMLHDSHEYQGQPFL